MVFDHARDSQSITTWYALQCIAYAYTHECAGAQAMPNKFSNDWHNKVSHYV